MGHRKEENRRSMTEPPARTEPGTATNHQGLPVMDSEILEMSPEKSDGIVEGIDVNGGSHFKLPLPKILILLKRMICLN